jgi:hypothetical protein
MEGNRLMIRMRRIRLSIAGCAIALSLSSCRLSVAPVEVMGGLSDRIDSEATSLKRSDRSGASVLHRVDLQVPWMIMFVPKKGFDSVAAREAGVSEEIVKEVSRRAESWADTAILVYVAPRESSVTRLPDNVDVRHQLILTGKTGHVELKVELVRMSDQILVASAQANQL